MACLKVCGGHPRGKLWKKGELDWSWESLDGKLLDGVKLDRGQKGTGEPPHPCSKSVEETNPAALGRTWNSWSG